jgi:hypothetical protein
VTEYVPGSSARSAAPCFKIGADDIATLVPLTNG